MDCLALTEADGGTVQADRLIFEADDLLDWNGLIYTLLVAHDRGDDVEAALKEWYGTGDKYAVVSWGRDYAMILAERDLCRGEPSGARRCFAAGAADFAAQPGGAGAAAGDFRQHSGKTCGLRRTGRAEQALEPGESGGFH